MAFHHLLLPLAFGPCVLAFRRGLGDFFVGCLYLVEASNPFLNLRAVLRLFNLHKSRVYLVNGVLMLVVFFCCRIAIFPFLYHSYANYSGVPVFEVPFSIPLKCNLGCVTLFSMQLYWFWLMVKATIKILKGRRD
jgi:hypothetical protein